VSQADARYALAYRGETPAGLSPYRLLDPHEDEVSEVNEFLDAQATRGLSVRSLRAYGYSLLNFWRWLLGHGKKLRELEEPDLWDYIRFQKQDLSRGKAEAAPKTINHRLTAACCLYRFHQGDDLPSGRGFSPARSHPYHHTVASTQGYLHPARSRRLKLRVRTPRRLVLPLRAEEVRVFLESLRTWRDLGITALMLSSGLRSREVIELTLDDLSIPSGEIRVRGKGDRERLLPLPPQASSVLQSYLEAERPPTSTRQLFVSLKGRLRGKPMTTAGLRSLFRHHRRSARVPKANPHRFRHTFGSDMARAGISLPALMKLMGHGDIHTTMIYVEISPKDVWEEFHRVVRTLRHETKILPQGS